MGRPSGSMEAASASSLASRRESWAAVTISSPSMWQLSRLICAFVTVCDQSSALRRRLQLVQLGLDALKMLCLQQARI
jgi:hypothetical protein